MANKKEPWEQSIYDTKEQEMLTRRGSRKRNQGSKIFMILLVLCLFILISLPIGWYIFQKVEENNTQKTEASISQSIANSQSAAKSSSEAAAKAASTEPSTTEESQASEEAEETTVVVDGEGIYQIAERTGVTIEDILKLNGYKSVDELDLQPGQVIRIK